MDPVTTTVELSPLWDFVFNLLYAVIPVLLTGVVTIATQKWIKIKLDDSSRAALEGALQKGASWALGKAREATTNIDINTKNQTVALAANYVVAATPGALARFGVTPDRLRELVEARVNEILLDKSKDIELKPQA